MYWPFSQYRNFPLSPVLKLVKASVRVLAAVAFPVIAGAAMRVFVDSASVPAAENERKARRPRVLTFGHELPVKPCICVIGGAL